MDVVDQQRFERSAVALMEKMRPLTSSGATDQLVDHVIDPAVAEKEPEPTPEPVAETPAPPPEEPPAERPTERTPPPPTPTKAKDLMDKMQEVSKAPVPEWCREYSFSDLDQLREQLFELNEQVRLTQMKIARSWTAL